MFNQEEKDNFKKGRGKIVRKSQINSESCLKKDTEVRLIFYKSKLKNYRTEKFNY